jgi:hypothetical protein
MNSATTHTVIRCEAPPVMGAATPALTARAFAQSNTLSLAERPAP